jgi:peptide chain release factor subunit 1
MRKSGILQKITKVEAVKDKPFISIYLNAEPNEHGRDDFNVFLKKQLSVHKDEFEEDSPEYESYRQDAERIGEYAENIPGSVNGVAIYACAGADYFQTLEFDVPFKENLFVVNDRPYLYPLARIVDQNPEFAVVLVDSNEAKIFLMQRGKILNLEEIENEKYNRSEVGGWSQMRFQRHIDEMRKQHAKEVAEELEKIVRQEDIRQIVLAGNKEVAIPLLREQFNDFLSERIVGDFRMQIHAAENEIMDEAESAIKQYDTLQDKEKTDELKEQNYDGGKGVAGVAETLQALENGQVQELYLTANIDKLAYDEKKVREILDEYAPIENGDLPDARHHRQIVDVMIAKALESAERVRFIEDESLLEDVGGVGALLRYTMSANNR